MGFTTPANAYACVLRAVDSRWTNFLTAMFVNIRGARNTSRHDWRTLMSCSCCDFRVWVFWCGLTSFCCVGVGTLYVTRGVYLSLFTTRISLGVFARVFFLCVVTVFFTTRVVVGLVDVNTSFVVVCFCEVAICAPLPVEHIRCNFLSAGVSGLIFFSRNLAMMSVSLLATYSMSQIVPCCGNLLQCCG